MYNANTFPSSLHIILEDLIAQKAKKDGISFNCAKLANALDMPRSMITRLIHADPSKRVTNPRIDTLIKIVNYFRANGFSITINDLLGISGHNVNAQEQALPAENLQQSIPLYAFKAKDMKRLGTVDIVLHALMPNAIALCADRDIKPMFKQGSIFVTDTTAAICNDNLVAIKLDGYDAIQIRKIVQDGNRQLLKAFALDEPVLVLTAKLRQQIIGVVVQVNAKT